MSTKVSSTSDTVTLDLLDTEVKSDMMDCEAISTVTIFNGKLDIEFFRNRVDEIIDKNQWLKGKLIRNKKGNIKLEYNKNEKTKHFYILNNIIMNKHKDVKSSMLYLSSSLTPYMVKKGKNCINKNELQFLVTIGKLNSEQFFIMISLSHVIGDGHTFYQIYGMFAHESTVLIGERELIKGNAINKENKESNDLFTSVGILLNFIGKFVFGKRCHSEVRLLDSDKIKSLKEEYAAQVKK